MYGAVTCIYLSLEDSLASVWYFHSGQSRASILLSSTVTVEGVRLTLVSSADIECSLFVLTSAKHTITP